MLAGGERIEPRASANGEVLQPAEQEDGDHDQPEGQDSLPGDGRHVARWTEAIAGQQGRRDPKGREAPEEDRQRPRLNGSKSMTPAPQSELVTGRPAR